MKKHKIVLFKKVASIIKDHKPELIDLARTLTEAGHSQDEVIEMVVSAVDALIDWGAIGAVAGPVGAVIGTIAEVIDAPVICALVKLLLHPKNVAQH